LAGSELAAPDIQTHTGIPGKPLDVLISCGQDGPQPFWRPGQEHSVSPPRHPNGLFKKGVTKNSIPVGSELVVGGYQARDGSLKAVARTITFADGRPLFFIGTELPDAVAQ
jgi:hypothetical protein